MRSKAAVARITSEAIEDFADENVKYVELRTTPRAIPAAGLTKRQYIETVLEEIQRKQKEGFDIVVRLLLSVDRSNSEADALDTVELAREFSPSGVVGLDFSGNPHANSFVQFARVFDLARSYGLKVTVHSAEIPHSPDTSFIFTTFRPDRVGHAVCLVGKPIVVIYDSALTIFNANWLCCTVVW